MKLWLSQRNSLSMLSCLDTGRYFTTDDLTDTDSLLDHQDWPPFRRVGTFDPFTDDPRYAVKTVDICCTTGLLLVGGMAGQLLVCSLDIKREFDIPLTDVDLMEEDEEFVWKGQEALDVRSCQFREDSKKSQNFKSDSSYQTPSPLPYKLKQNFFHCFGIFP